MHYHSFQRTIEITINNSNNVNTLYQYIPGLQAAHFPVYLWHSAAQLALQDMLQYVPKNPAAHAAKIEGHNHNFRVIGQQ